MSSILLDQIDLKQTSSHTYRTSHHADWTVGPTLHGGHVAAAVHRAAATHLSTTLASQDQPDVLTLHIEFLRACEVCDLEIVVTDLKLGAATSTIQLQVSQNGKTRVVALATSINFDKPAGPTVPTDWALSPPPKPIPNFERVLAHEPEENWLPVVVSGDIVPFTRRLLVLNPRGGFPAAGCLDLWNATMGSERMDASYLALMADSTPAMSDALLRNRGLYDVHWKFPQLEQAAREKPGVPVEMFNSFEEAARATVSEYTVTLDIEYKRRLPKEGVQWIFTRATTKMLAGGRMDLDVVICDQHMELLCLTRQAVLVLDAKRKFGGPKKAGPAL